MMCYVLIVVLILSVAVQLMYWLGLFWRLKRPSISDQSDPLPHAIVVCYKNERDRLSALAQILTAQAASEIVMVDDYSDDGSADIVKDVGDERLLLTHALVDRPGKKAALHHGLSTSTTEHVVLTDADCRPATDRWSLLMSYGLTDTQVVLGYGPTSKTNGLLNTFARYETYLTAIQYLSYAQRGIPYMAVGRNMAVRRSSALAVAQQLMHDELASGDDDLLVQALSPSVSICIEPEAFVYSDAPNDWSSYVNQKSRHMTTSTHYRWYHQLLLGLYAGTHISTFAILIALCILCPAHVGIAISLLVVKWILQMLVNTKLMDMLDEKDLWWKFPLLDIATFAYYVVMTPLLILKNRRNWS